MPNPPAEQAGSSIARNTTYLTAALIGQKVLSALYVPILARLVGISVTGDYLGALSFTTLFAVFLDIGLTPAFIRSTARDQTEGRRRFQEIITFKLLAACVVLAALFGSVWWLSAVGRSHPDIRFLQWAAFAMVLDSLTSTSYAFFRGMQRLEFESFGTILHRLIVMIVGITGLVLGAPPLVAIIAVVSGSIANFLYATFHLWRQGIQWHFHLPWARLKFLLREAWPFGLAAILAAIYSSSDNILLSIFTGRHDVGLYGTAAKIVVAFQVIPAALVAAIFPAMSAAFISDRDRLQRIFTSSMQYLMIVVIPVAVVIPLLAHDIILLGWKKVWLEAVWPLQVLTLGLPFLFLNFPVGYLLNASNKQTRNTINIAITVIINISSNLLFINAYGYKAVTINAVVSSALLFFLGLLQVRKIIDVPWKLLGLTALKAGLGGAIVAALGWKLLPIIPAGYGTLLLAGGLGLVYLLLIFALRMVAVNDAKQFLQRFRRS